MLHVSVFNFPISHIRYTAITRIASPPIMPLQTSITIFSNVLRSDISSQRLYPTLTTFRGVMPGQLTHHAQIKHTAHITVNHIKTIPYLNEMRNLISRNSNMSTVLDQAQSWVPHSLHDVLWFSYSTLALFTINATDFFPLYLSRYLGNNRICFDMVQITLASANKNLFASASEVHPVDSFSTTELPR